MTQADHDVTQWAVIYCRVSTKEQTKNLSLETQRKVCTEYCRRSDYGIAEIFVEKGESAKTADRTELKKLLAYCRENKGLVQVVVVYNLSRFARDRYDHATLRMLLHKLGVTLRSATEAIDDSSTGKLMEGVLSAFAQFDNDTRSDRTRDGMKAALEAGRWPFRPPLGYLRDPSSGARSTIVQDPEVASLVAMAFEDYATGRYSKLEVLKRVTAKGLRMSNGRPLSKQTLDKILKNEIYAGWVVSKKWGRHEGNHVALITDKTFARVQALVSGRKNAGIRHIRDNADFPLRRFVRCAKCGKPFTGSWSTGRSKKYPNYRCQSHCKGTNIRKKKLEMLFVQYLKRIAPKKEYVSLFRALVLSTWEDKKKSSIDEGKELAKRIAKLKERRNRLEDTFLFERSIDKDTYHRQHDKLRQDIALAELALHDAKLEKLDVEGLLAYAESILLNPGQLWIDAPFSQRQRLQTAIFPNGVTFADEEFGTTEMCLLFRLMSKSEDDNDALVRLKGLEPPTPGSEDRCSIQLSYRRMQTKPSL